jgi:hypothetical protein
MRTNVHWDEATKKWMVTVTLGGPLNDQGAALAVIMDGVGETMTLSKFMKSEAFKFISFGIRMGYILDEAANDTEPPPEWERHW